jgi:hypothetical protein
MNIEQEIKKLPETEKVRFKERVDDTLYARALILGQSKEKYSDPEMTNLKEQIYHQLFN